MNSDDWVVAAAAVALFVAILVGMTAAYKLEARKLDILEKNGCAIQVVR
jgi:hypothetical protein